MVIMNYTLLNVFLAIAVDGLADFEVGSVVINRKFERPDYTFEMLKSKLSCENFIKHKSDSCDKQLVKSLIV